MYNLHVKSIISEREKKEGGMRSLLLPQHMKYSRFERTRARKRKNGHILRYIKELDQHTSKCNLRLSIDI